MTARPTIDPDAIGITDAATQRTGSVVEQLLAPADVRVEQLPVELLFDHPDNPRGSIGDVDELAASIKANGILEPLIVVPAAAWSKHDDRLPHCEAGDYVLIAGHRRKAAAVQAGQATVPCLVREDLVGAAAEVAMLVENLQREGLSAIEEARGFSRLEEQGKSQREMARLVGCTQPHVSKRLALLKLPDDIVPLIGTADLPIAAAVELAKIGDEPKLIKTVLKRPSWQTVDQAVEAAIKDRDKATALDARKKQLRDSGIANIVKFPQYGFYSSGGSQVPLKQLEDDGVDITEHEHFACHAAAVGYTSYSDELRVEYICTNPPVHGESKAAKALAERDDYDKKRAREREKEAKRRAERVAILGGLCKTPTADVENLALTALLDQLLEQFYGDDYNELAGLLDIPVPDDAGRDYFHDLDDDPVLLLAGKDAKSLRRVVCTAALLLLDGELRHGSTAAKTYLRLLQARGYKLDRDEKRANADQVAPVEVPAPADRDLEQLLEASEAVG